VSLHPILKTIKRLLGASLAFQRAHTPYTLSLQHTSLVRQTAGEISVFRNEVCSNKYNNEWEPVSRPQKFLALRQILFNNPQNRMIHGKA
jgi:hypothetical protein